jgi:signal transduction histidine kinase
MDHSDTPGATPGSPESDALVAWVIMQNGVEQDIIVEALESHSCRVCTPADMRAAVELVSQIPPSLVLLSTCQSDRAVQLTETLSTSLAREPCTFVMVTKDIEQIGSTAWSELGISEFLEVPATVSAAHNSVGPFCRIARLNRQLRDAEQRADAANRTKAEFLRNINHELRTPMTTIQGIAELLLDEGDIEQAPPHRVASLQELIDHAKEMSQRVDNILELSRLEDGAMEIRLRQVSPLDILNTIRKDFWHLATNKGLEFSVDLSGAVPQTVLTDADCLKQVLRHIVGNAVKFTSEGHVTVRSRTLLQLSRPLWKRDRHTGEENGNTVPAVRAGGHVTLTGPRRDRCGTVHQ